MLDDSLGYGGDNMETQVMPGASPPPPPKTEEPEIEAKEAPEIAVAAHVEKEALNTTVPTKVSKLQPQILHGCIR